MSIVQLEKLNITIRLATIVSILGCTFYLGGQFNELKKERSDIKEIVSFVNLHRQEIVKVDCLSVKIDRHVIEDLLEKAQIEQQLKDYKDVSENSK